MKEINEDDTRSYNISLLNGISIAQSKACAYFGPLYRASNLSFKVKAHEFNKQKLFTKAAERIPGKQPCIT